MRRWIQLIAVASLFVAARAPAQPPGPDYPPASADPVAPDALVLTTGEVLRGTIVESTNEAYVLEHPVLGRLVIPHAAVTSIQHAGDLPPASPPTSQPASAPPDVSPVPTPPPTIDGAAVPQSPQPPPAKADATGKPRVWTARFEAGASATSGNTDETAVTAGLAATRTTETNILKLDSLYRLNTTGGDRKINEFTAGAFSEWPLPNSRWSFFAQGRFDYDEFVSWDYRVTASGGVGYRLIDLKHISSDGRSVDVLRLGLRAGAGARREFGSDIDTVQPEGLFGAELKWWVSPRQRLEAESTIYPSLSALGEFRLITTGSWVIDLDHLNGLSFKVGVKNEYESQTDPGVKHDDLAVYSSLVVNF